MHITLDTKKESKEKAGEPKRVLKYSSNQDALFDIKLK